MTEVRRSGVWWRRAYGLLCCCSGLVLAGTRWDLLEIFSHFQLQLGSCWLLAFALLAVPKVRAAFWRPGRSAALGLVLALAHGGLIAGLWLPSSGAALDREPARIQAVWFNMQHSAEALSSLAAGMRADPPDLWVLIETNGDTAPPQPELYPHVFHDEPHHLGIWSRWPLENTRAEAVPEERDQLTADLVIGRYRLPLLAVHWRIPIHAAQLRAVETSIRIAQAREHLLMLGDLNSTPWSPRFRRLEDEGGLRRGPGLGARGTWAADPWHILSLPIDQGFTKGEVRITELELLPWTASDHRPVRARIDFVNRR